MPKPKKNTPDNSVLFQKSNFNTTIQESDNPHSVERRNMERIMRRSNPECRKDAPTIVATPNLNMLRYAKLSRLRNGEGWNNASGLEIDEAQNFAPGW